MELITSTMRMQASFFTFATMVALFSHSLVIPVMSTSEYYSPKPSTAITPPAGDSPANINCNTPPHGGSGGGGGGSDGHHEPSTPSRSPSSGHHDGGGGSGGSGGYHYSPPPYTPTTPTPTIPTPKTPVVTPTTDPHTTTPSTPNPTPTPTTPTYTPRTPTVAPPTVPHTPAIPIPTTPPSVGTPPFPFPNTPPFSFDPRIPSSSGPFPCTFWRMHPTMIWGIMGWNGNTVSSTFGVGNVGGFGAGMNLLEALSNTRTDGFGELYREGTAALLNSMASNGFPFSAQQVKLSFGRAALSSNGDAAAAQAQLFKMANEGRYKPASP